MSLGDIIYQIIDCEIYDSIDKIFEHNFRIDIYVEYFGFEYHHIVRGSIVAY
jgi:hypothetical protein